MSISCQLKNIKILAGFRLFLFLLERKCSLSTFVSLLSSSSGTRFNVNYVGGALSWICFLGCDVNASCYLTSKLLSSREFSFGLWFTRVLCFLFVSAFGEKWQLVGRHVWLFSLTTKLFKLHCYCTGIFITLPTPLLPVPSFSL
jgi:hypothetical protein